jgi:HD-GYP domain-containing protein (c-di-GMP phosphodiesterase class II)
MSQKNPPKPDAQERVRVQARDLRLGMFVCELDRPWLETPFLMQGFELNTPADIEAVQEHCEYVYVDMLRTSLAQNRSRVPTWNSFRSPQKTTSFDKEIQAAETATKQTSNLVRTVLDDIRFGGGGVDVQMSKEAVSGCVASILRNPDAMVFMTQMQEKSEWVGQHAVNACVYAIIMGRLIGLNAKQLEDLGTCGLLHDIGLVSIPDEILNKPGRLTEEEHAIVRQHTRLGRDILMSGRKVYSGTVDVAFGHHEHLDGSGYPRGLQGSALNLNCRIVSVVEKYDSIVSARPYRPAYTHLDALNRLSKMVKENHLDKEVVDYFVSYLGIYPPGSIVELSNGEKAIVLETNPGQRMRPKILVVRDRDNNPIAARFVDMASTQADEQNQPYKIKAVHRPGAFGINLPDYRNVVMQNVP